MNSRGYTVTSITIAFMAVTLLSVPGFGGNAYAAGIGMSITVDTNADSHSIMISGGTDRSDPVMIIVTAPNGNIVHIDQVTPTGNSYSATISVGGNQYKQDGMYAILVQQGAESGDTTEFLSTVWKGGQDRYKFSAQVEITSGTTSATSITKSSCYGYSDRNINANELPGERTQGESALSWSHSQTASPCKYDPTLSASGAPISSSIQTGGISDGYFTITADAVLGSTTIDVSGKSLNTGAYGSADVMLKVIAPNGNIVAVDQVTPSDGSYSATISIGGSQYMQNGMYTIIASQAYGSFADVSASHQSDQAIWQFVTASTEVEIVDGHVVPEFGTIAAMILVVAIIAIIAVSAKTKLSLVPRY